MKRLYTSVLVELAAAIGVSALSGGVTAQQPAVSPEQRVAALKQSIQEGQAKLRRYEWIETTVISLKGEEKSRKQQRCYYSDGFKTSQKVP